METKYKIFSAGLINLAIPEAHYDEAVKLLSEGGVSAIPLVKEKFPDTRDALPFLGGSTDEPATPR